MKFSKIGNPPILNKMFMIQLNDMYFLCQIDLRNIIGIHCFSVSTQMRKSKMAAICSSTWKPCITMQLFIIISTYVYHFHHEIPRKTINFSENMYDHFDFNVKLATQTLRLGNEK